jgi:hypothetical protein
MNTLLPQLRYQAQAKRSGDPWQFWLSFHWLKASDKHSWQFWLSIHWLKALISGAFALAG